MDIAECGDDQVTQTNRDSTPGSQMSAVLLFLLLTLTLSTPFYVAIILIGRLEAARVFVAGLMWCPGVAALLTCRAHHIPVATLGWRWDRAHQIWACLLPAGYSLAVYLIIWSTPLGGMPSSQLLVEWLENLQISAALPLWMATAPVLAALFLGSCALALGEEIGWRGFLTPRLTAGWGFRRGSLAVGSIWAAWHLPLVLFADYNAGTPVWWALSWFTVMMIALSVIYTWFQLKTASLWAVALLHGVHNFLVQVVFTPLTISTALTPYAIGEFGFVLPMVIAMTAGWFWIRRNAVLAPSHGLPRGLNGSRPRDIPDFLS